MLKKLIHLLAGGLAFSGCVYDGLLIDLQGLPQGEESAEGGHAERLLLKFIYDGEEPIIEQPVWRSGGRLLRINRSAAGRQLLIEGRKLRLEILRWKEQESPSPDVCSRPKDIYFGDPELGNWSPSTAWISPIAVSMTQTEKRFAEQQPETEPDLLAVAPGQRGTDAWAVGTKGGLYHYRYLRGLGQMPALPCEWERTRIPLACMKEGGRNSPDLRSIFSIRADKPVRYTAYAVGNQATVLRYRASTDSTAPGRWECLDTSRMARDTELRSVWLSSDGQELWVAGSVPDRSGLPRGVIWHASNAQDSLLPAWAEVQQLGKNQPVSSIWGFSSGDVWIGTSGFGVARLSSFLTPPAFEPIDPKALEGLPNAPVLGGAGQPGAFWIAASDRGAGAGNALLYVQNANPVPPALKPQASIEGFFGDDKQQTLVFEDRSVWINRNKPDWAVSEGPVVPPKIKAGANSPGGCVFLVGDDGTFAARRDVSITMKCDPRP